MGHITSNGRTVIVECDRLEIPGKCIVDFRDLTVWRDQCSAPGHIDPRLAILLDYFYTHRNNFLSLAQLEEYQYGFSGIDVDKSMRTDIGNLRKVIGDTEGKIIETKRGVGYRLVLDEKETDKPFTLEDIFKKLTLAGEIKEIFTESADGGLMIGPVSKARASTILSFLIADSIFPCQLTASEKEELVCGNIHTVQRKLQEFFRQTVLYFDAAWEANRSSIRKTLVRIQKLKGIMAFSAPIPATLEELNRFPIDSQRMLDLLYDKIIIEIEKLMDARIVRQTFLSNTKAVVAKANVLDGIVAASFIAMYFLANRTQSAGNESFIQDASRFRSRLAQKLRDLFLPGEAPLDDPAVILESVRLEFLERIKGELDAETALTVMKIYDGTFNLNAFYSNRTILGGGSSNEREKDSPIKIR